MRHAGLQCKDLRLCILASCPRWYWFQNSKQVKAVTYILSISPCNTLFDVSICARYFQNCVHKSFVLFQYLRFMDSDTVLPRSLHTSMTTQFESDERQSVGSSKLAHFQALMLAWSLSPSAPCIDIIPISLVHSFWKVTAWGICYVTTSQRPHNQIHCLVQNLCEQPVATSH